MSIQEPLRFRPILLEKVWGGCRLASFVDGALADDARVGEVWSLVDRPEGGSEVEGGTFAGRSLHGLMLSEREALLGDAPAGPDDTFPLLVKLLDASSPLSVQVHPDRAAAERLGGEARAKDECWYVLDADEDCGFLLGLREGVDATTFARDAAGPEVVDLLQSFTARPGQFVPVPAGTVHSIGAGITMVEIQDNADTTLRIYDWDRPGLDGNPRTCHLEQALEAMTYDAVARRPQVPELEDLEGTNQRATLPTGARFAVELLVLHEAWSADTGRRPSVLFVLEGRGHLRRVEGDGEWPVGPGQTWLVPADLGAHSLQGTDGQLRVLRVTLDPEQDA